MLFTKKTTDTCFIAVFALILFFPLAAKQISLGTQTEEMMLRENRTIEPRPSLWGERFRYRDVKRFPERMERHLSDTLPYRRRIISALMRLEHESFGRQPASGIIGKQNWLFYNLPSNGTVDDFLGNIPLSKEEFLASFDELLQKRIWFDSVGVTYCCFIAPNKVTIYPEFLPDAIQQSKGDSRREQFMRYYREHIAENNIPDFIIDPADRLLAEKSDAKLLYFPQDTHWNWSGRLIGSEALLERLRGVFPGIGVPPDVPTEETPTAGGDLVRMLNITETRKRSETFPAPDEDAWSGMDIFRRENPLIHQYQNRNAPETAKNALFLSDSFFLNFPPPEAFVFNTLVLHHRSNADAVEVFKQLQKQHPIDIVVEECVERGFAGR